MQTIGIDELKQMILSAANNLQNMQKHINDLNIFPVPDGDTGTNMGLTFVAASQDKNVSGAEGAGEALNALAKAALRNARGNSGVILSQILRGISVGADGKAELGVADIKNMAANGRDTAYRAVMKPTEGTILTVVREIAVFAENNFAKYDDVLEFLNDILEKGKESLARTPEILPVLKKAGVVDAGGQGVITLLEGAVSALNGEIIDLSPEAVGKIQPKVVSTENVNADIKFLYCTEFLVNKPADRHAAQFEAAIRPKGDCMLVIEDDEIVKVHIHTNHPGYVIEQALKLGELTNLKIDNMKYQHNERISRDDAEDTKPTQPAKEYGFVAVASGDGLAEIFKSIGADFVVEGGQTMNPSTQDILDAVEKVNAKNVFVLPNNKNIILAAEQAAELAECNVIVIPTKNIPQGISAMLAFDEGMECDENREAMIEMAEGVACGQITFAARDSNMDDKAIHEGEIMGMIGSQIEVLGEDKEEVALELTEKLVTSDSGVIAVYYGADVTEDEAEGLKEKLTEKYSDMDVSVSYGGQAVYYYIISVE